MTDAIIDQYAQTVTGSEGHQPAGNVECCLLQGIGKTNWTDIMFVSKVQGKTKVADIQIDQEQSTKTYSQSVVDCPQVLCWSDILSADQSHSTQFTVVSIISTLLFHTGVSP